MDNINFSLVLNKEGFSDYFPKRDKVVRKWTFSSDTVDKKNIMRLYEKIFNDYVGWTSCEIEKIKNEIRIKFTLIILINSEKSDSETDLSRIIGKSVRMMEEFVIEHKLNSQMINYSSNLLPNNEKVFIVDIGGQNDSKMFRELVSKLKDNDEGIHVEYEYSKRSDVGAEGGLFEVIGYINDSVISGILYDYLKLFPFMIITNVNKERVDILKEKAANHLEVHPSNVGLVYLKEDENTKRVETKFDFNGKVYQINFDAKNNIVFFKKERNTGRKKL